MNPSDSERRLLRALATVPQNGRLEPLWEPRARLGFVYGGRAGGSDDDRLADDLATLAERGFVEAIFVERLMICSACDSHAVNVHEACVKCGSAHLTAITSYFHFRCGFIGPEKAFAKEPGGLRCPKCNKLLVDRGTAFDSPGDFFECESCSSLFQQPQMAVRCLGCGATYLGARLHELRYRDVHAYRRTLRGDAALTRGSLRSEDVVET